MIVLATVRADGPFADELIARWATQADRNHAASRKNLAARYHSLLARAGMRALLFSHTAQSDWQLCADARGKLSPIGQTGRAGPAISIAHTRGVIACGLATIGAFGIDVEIHRPRAFDAIAAWSFGQQERSAVRAGQAASFYRIWTLREAMGKATGEGLALATDGRDRTSGPNEGVWQQKIDGQSWLLGHFRTDAETSLAVAALLENEEQGADITSSVRWIDLTGVQRTA